MKRKKFSIKYNLKRSAKIVTSMYELMYIYTYYTLVWVFSHVSYMNDKYCLKMCVYENIMFQDINIILFMIGHTRQLHVYTYIFQDIGK